MTIYKYMQFTLLYLNVTYFHTFYNKKKIDKENCTGVKDNGNTLFEQAILIVSMYMESKRGIIRVKIFETFFYYSLINAH